MLLESVCTCVCVREGGKGNNQDKFHAEPLIWQCVSIAWTYKSLGGFAFETGTLTGTLTSDFNRFPGTYRCPEVFLEFLKQDKTTLTLGMWPSEFICKFWCLNALGISCSFMSWDAGGCLAEISLACPTSLPCPVHTLQLPAFSELAILIQCFLSIQQGPISLSSFITLF